MKWLTGWSSTASPLFQSSPRLLVEANVEKDALERLIGQFSVPVLHDVLTRIIAAAGAEKLSQMASAIVGVIGALVGTFGGYHIRHTLVQRAHLPDAVALAEDFIAIAGGLLIVSHR